MQGQIRLIDSALTTGYLLNFRDVAIRDIINGLPEAFVYFFENQYSLNYVEQL